jgi:hypothetical protein
MLRVLRLCLLCLGAARVAANVTNTSANLTAASTDAQTGARNDVQRSPIWSLDPRALAAAGCNDTDAARVKLCETRKQASFYHTGQMSASEEWCLEVYVTVACWPPCFCNDTSSSLTSSSLTSSSLNSLPNSSVGYAWAKQHLEAQSCTALPPCTQTVAKAAETPEKRPVLSAAPRACLRVVDTLVFLVLTRLVFVLVFVVKQ